jgi:hypothetical protein
MALWFAVLAIGPVLGAIAMYRLRREPEARRLANGRIRRLPALGRPLVALDASGSFIHHAIRRQTAIALGALATARSGLRVDSRARNHSARSLGPVVRLAALLMLDFMRQRIGLRKG